MAVGTDPSLFLPEKLLAAGVFSVASVVAEAAFPAVVEPSHSLRPTQ